jgi:pimeloyl-ACP methyl ester carboxylesterase
VDFEDGEPIAAPTLILVGESALDRTVPPDVSRRYSAWIPHAEVRTLASTGHLGTVTRAATFAHEVGAFVDREDAAASGPRHTAAM